MIGSIILFIFSVGPTFIFPQSTPQKAIDLLTVVKTTIQNNPSIRIQQEQVKIYEGMLQSAGGQFDVSMQSQFGASNENTPLLKAQQTSGISTLSQEQSFYNFGVYKQFRSGILLSSELNFNRISDQFSNRTVPNYAGANVTATVPLLRGRGKAATAATEMAFTKNHDASKLSLNHTTSLYVYNTVTVYWNYVAATHIVAIQNESEKRAEKLVNETQTLIDAEERPQAEINQLKANLADKISARISSEQNLYVAKQNLGLAMGIRNHNIDLLPLPADEFPTISSMDFDSVLIQSKFIRSSLEKRADLKAAVYREDAAKILLREAQNREKPQLSLSINAGYNGLNEGDNLNQYFTPFKQNISGLNFGSTISYEIPTGIQHGLAVQRIAEYEQSNIESDEIARNIKSSVAVAINELKRSIQRLEKSRESIEFYRTTVENEKLKFQQGLSTLIDLILYEDRLTNALLNQVSSQLSYATAVAKLRYETGTLIEFENNDIAFDIDHLISIPYLEDSGK